MLLTIWIHFQTIYIFSGCDLGSELGAGGGNVYLVRPKGGQDQHHEDQEHVDLGHHDPVLS